jgi:glutaredoxin
MYRPFVLRKSKSIEFLVFHATVMVVGTGVLFMINNSQIFVYTLETCPNCEILKLYLDTMGAAYEIRDMMSAEALTELRINGVFVREAPVLQKKKQFLTTTELFKGGVLNTDQIASLLTGE